MHPVTATTLLVNPLAFWGLMMRTYSPMQVMAALRNVSLDLLKQLAYICTVLKEQKGRPHAKLAQVSSPMRHQCINKRWQISVE